MSYSASVAQLAQQAAAAFLRHARRPAVLGPADEHQRLWLLLYEARSAATEGNPAFAATLLPASDTTPATGPGLPLLPVGVRVVVDQDAPNVVTVTLEVGGPVTVTVLPPGLGATAFTPPVTSTATRSTALFLAPTDGLYQLTLTANGNPLATVYVPVLRALWRTFRELVRYQRFAFRARRPGFSPDLTALYARLACAEAAAHTGDPVLFAQLVASAQAIAAPSPVALYPDA